jgi:CHAD domain-containing protein
MAKAKKEAVSAHSDGQPSYLGPYAYQIIQDQFDRILGQQKSVLEDTNAEHLHHMRVGTRRLRTALQVFEGVVDLPQAAGNKRLRNLARVLGAVRDLDVQIADLQDHYCPQLSSSEQRQIEKVIASLKQQRLDAFTQLKKALKSDRYELLVNAYQDWLAHPRYHAIAQMPIITLLPDLLTPLLSHLLSHPAWLISTQQLSDSTSLTLHDLRKTCKQARYQAEFFTFFYGKEFHKWIKEIKDLQDQLGKYQDTQVLLEILRQQLKQSVNLSEFTAAIQTTQEEAMSNWERIRQKYLEGSFRYQLHQMILQPTLLAPSLHEEPHEDRVDDLGAWIN